MSICLPDSFVDMSAMREIDDTEECWADAGVQIVCLRTHSNRLHMGSLAARSKNRISTRARKRSEKLQLPCSDIFYQSQVHLIAASS